MTKNILIVNENVEEANIIRSRMASPSTNAVCAHTVHEALASFENNNFCLVILDASLSASDDHNILKAMWHNILKG